MIDQLKSNIEETLSDIIDSGRITTTDPVTDREVEEAGRSELDTMSHDGG